MQFRSTLIAALGIAVALPAAAAPESFTIDSRHTFPSFEILHLGYSFQRGRFNKTAGTLTIDEAAKSGSVEVTIDTASVDTGLEALEKHLRNEDFFNVEKFPSMTFKSNRFRFEGDKLVAVEGDFTLLGVTKPVTLAVDYFRCAEHRVYKRKVCGANATTTIKRSDFGLGLPKYTPAALGDDVKIAIQIEAIKDQ